jgi:hypothetical protein
MLGLARILMVAWMIINIFYLSVSLPSYYQSRQNLEPGELTGTAFYGWTTQQIEAVMLQLGLQPETVVIAMFSTSLICLGCFWIVAGLLFWRRSDTWVGILAAFILFMTGPGFSGMLLTQSQAPLWINRLNLSLADIVWPTFFILIYLFPNGKFVPPFTRYLAALPYLVFLSDLILPSGSPFISFGPGVIIIYGIGGLISQVYRFRKISTPEERQQTKWVVFALGIFLVALISSFLNLSIFPSFAVGTPGGFWNEFLGNGVWGFLIPALIPLSIGVSILRYRLWDVDVIIRKTLVYTALTISLALVFFGVVALLQQIVGRTTGTEDSPVAIVISTLVITALFSLLRWRIQDFIDRRFYRSKYNAEQALEGFAATARDETDLEALTGKLVEVVSQTVQPEQVMLWIYRSGTRVLPPAERSTK